MHVFSVLSKPVDFNVLLDSLARVLKRYHEAAGPANRRIEVDRCQLPVASLTDGNRRVLLLTTGN